MVYYFLCGDKFYVYSIYVLNQYSGVYKGERSLRFTKSHWRV